MVGRPLDGLRASGAEALQFEFDAAIAYFPIIPLSAASLMY
jgi:hypothetical protein